MPQEMFTHKGLKKIAEVNIKRYFENNPSVAEKRKFRVETEAITSTVSRC